MRIPIGRKTDDSSAAAARISRDYRDAVDFLENNEALIYIEADAYNLFMEKVNAEASLSKWMKGLGKFYAGPNGLYMLFNTLLSDQSSTGGRSGAGDKDFYLFIKKFVEGEYENYKGRNNKGKDRFELMRIK